MNASASFQQRLLPTDYMCNENFNHSIHSWLIGKGYEFTAKNGKCWVYEKGDTRIKFLSSDLQELVVIDLKVSGKGWISYCQFTCPDKLEKFKMILRAYSL